MNTQEPMITPATNRYLRTKARQQAGLLGHAMSNFRCWSDSAGFWQAVSICLSCGLLIEINDPPKSITGAASKRQCSKRYVIAASRTSSK
jgi:hypothetical protein